ncbi:MAG TPA: 4Fe-4S binding protein, partial [Gammaproteobacteria bacterium]|nr:4Fe-4S binding protein [Gammaproteobacteria bacterium]
LTGTFDKPEYFHYDPDCCAHARNGVTACTRCIDACPAQAIHSLLERVEVDPYLCQGGGVCATVCPSGAIGYAYPRGGDLGRRMRRLLLAFREAGGQLPVLLIHAGEPVSEARLRAQPSLLPFPVEEVASVGAESWLSALAWGAHRVVLELDSMPAPQVRLALDGQLQMVSELLRGMDYPDSAVLISEAGGWSPGVGSGMPDIEPAAHAAMDDKRTALFLALDHLHDQAARCKPLVPLSAGAPFGAASVEARACTLCMACTGVCPTHALQSGRALPQLRFIEANCIQCGLCTRTCPENAISITPRILLSRDERNRPRVLHEEPPFCCVSCGRPFATRSVVDKMLTRLAGHWMFQNERARQRLKMCDECRVADIVQDPESMPENDILHQ